VRFGPRSLKGALMWVALGGLIALGFLAYHTQKRLWQLDMEAKRSSG
jgi:hypothetical protein